MLLLLDLLFLPQSFEDRYFRKFEISWAIFSVSCVLTCPVESKPNSRMIKMKTIGVVLMASSIIDKKSRRPECRPEHRATDLRGRTRRKGSSLSLGRLDLPSYYVSQAFEDRDFGKSEIFLCPVSKGKDLALTG